MRRLACFTLFWLLAPAPAAEVIVTVTAAETGEPLEGAEAAVLVQYEDRSLGVDVHRVLTDAEGVARIDCPMPAGSEAWEHLFVRARGRKEWWSDYGGPRGNGRRWVESPKVTSDDRHERKVALEVGPTIRGVVRDSDGRPIAGAKIRSSLQLFGGGNASTSVRYSAEVGWPPDEMTDADGRFELWSARPDLAAALNCWAGVEASHPDYAPYCLAGVDRLPLDDRGLIDVELRLDAGVSLDGIVLGDGLPLSDAEVRLWPKSAGDFGDFLELFRKASTGPDGGFRFDGLAPRMWEVLARAEGFRERQQTVTIGADEGLPVVVELQPGCSLEVTALEADGRPAAGERVSYKSESGWGYGVADAEGHTRLDGLPLVGEVLVVVGFGGPVQPVVLPSPPVTVRKLPEVPLRVEVTDEVSGQPLGGPDCRWCWIVTSGGSTCSLLTPDGRPEREKVHPGEYHFYTLFPDRPITDRVATIPPNADYPPIKLALPRGERLFGRLTDHAGRPVAGALVRGSARRRLEDVRRDVSGPDGEWSLPGLAGQTSIFVLADGYSPAVSGPLKLEESGGERRIDLTLERGGRLEGVLRTADGRPRPWRTVTAKPISAIPFNMPLPLAITAADGSFRLENVPLGMVTVFGDGATAEVAVSAGETSTVSLVR